MVTRSTPIENKALIPVEVSGRGRSPAGDQEGCLTFSASRHSLEAGDAAAYAISHDTPAAAASFTTLRSTSHCKRSLW